MKLWKQIKGNKEIVNSIFCCRFIVQHGHHGGHLELRNKTESCNKSKSICQTFMKRWKQIMGNKEIVNSIFCCRFIFELGGHLELRNKTESCNKSKSISQTFMKLWKQIDGNKELVRHGGQLEFRNKSGSCNKSKSMSQTFMKLWKQIEGNKENMERIFYCRFIV